jgi:hypothetical protein
MIRAEHIEKVDRVLRFLIFLLGILTVSRPGHRDTAWYQATGLQHSAEPGALRTGPDRPADGATALSPPRARPPWPPWPPSAAGGAGPANPGGRAGGPGPRRSRVPRWIKLTAVVVVVGLIFRRAIASVVLVALSAALHLVGINVHLPSIKFGWPWQTTGARASTNTDLGPWVLQKIEGISKPALGQANFNFLFTHKISKNIGPWPCWYASTFDAVGHASATVDLNPGPTWWTPASGHYRLQVLSLPAAGKPGHVTVTMTLPRPQLPQSVHDVTIDDIPSKPVDTQHSWTYPGFGCGVVLRPQFAQSVLYSQAQRIAFDKSTHAAQITGPLVRTAETEAVQTVRDNFIQPAVNAFGYTLDRFTIRWAAGP